MVRKLTIFLIFVLIGLTTFLVGYSFNKETDTTGQQALINNSLVDRFNKTEEKYVEPTGIFTLTSGEASFPTISADNSEAWYYVPKSGEIRSASIRSVSASSTLVAKIQSNASDISWGSNKTLVATYPTGSIYYDLTSNFSKKYPTQIKNPSLSNSGLKVAYNNFNKNTGEGNLTISDPKLESYKNILPTRFADWQISWVEDSKLALVKPPTLDNTTTSLFLLDVEEKTLQNILDSKNNLEVKWSPDHQKVLYSYADFSTQQNSLYVMNVTTRQEEPLNLTYTASRCTWSLDSKTIYCAGKDSFVYFNVTAKAIETNVVPNSQTADASVATGLFLTSTENYLIFKNSRDGKLYGLHIGK